MVTIVERCTSQYWWLRLLKDVTLNVGGLSYLTFKTYKKEIKKLQT